MAHLCLYLQNTVGNYHRVNKYICCKQLFPTLYIYFKLPCDNLLYPAEKIILGKLKSALVVPIYLKVKGYQIKQ